MKRKALKRIATVLALALTTTSALAGCGNDSKETNVQQSSVTESSVESSGEEVSQESTEGVVEKKGSITVMTYDRANIAASEGDYNNNRWTQWIRENAPVAEINWVGIVKAEAPETMTLLHSGGDAPDLLPNYEKLLPFYQNGMCMEITDEMLDKMPNYKRLVEDHPIVEKVGKVEGKRVYFTKFASVSPNHNLVIRQDWLDNLDLEVPETVDDLYDVCYAFTYNDPDGNGIDDTWGITLTTDSQRILAHMFGFGNPAKYKIDENGEVVYAWDRIEAWLDFCKSLVKDKLVNPDFITMKGDDDQADFLNGKIGIYGQAKFSQNNRNLYKSFKEAFPEGELTGMALPETEFGQYTAYISGGGSTCGYINVDCKDVDAVLAYANWLYDPEVSQFLTYGSPDPESDYYYYEVTEDGTYTIVDEEKRQTEMGYLSDYRILTNGGSATTGNPFANAGYNQKLLSTDEVLHGYGDLDYQLCLIANEPGIEDPRKWQNDGMPALPTDLALISTTADTQVNDILLAAIANTELSTEDAMVQVQAAWYDAGGQAVDDFYKNYYKEQGNNALLPSDYLGEKIQPQLTEAAKANSKLFK